ncbi:MAG: PilZ domain-containing protein [Firmicutes bacterium]|nr:PilZ domain-containing protein [Bacillota bacterium]
MRGGPTETDKLHLQAIMRSPGARVDIWFTDLETAHHVSGVISPGDDGVCVTIAPDSQCPRHGTFKAQVYTPTGLRALAGFAVRFGPTDVRLFPLGRIVHRERRHSVRVPFDAPISYRLLDFGGHDLTGVEALGQGRTLDIGTSGLAFSTPIRLPEGLTLGVSIDAPGWKDFGEIPCTVNRNERTLTCWITGAAFARPSPDFRTFVNRVILEGSRALRSSRR